jgi:hypothetical protein
MFDWRFHPAQALNIIRNIYIWKTWISRMKINPTWKIARQIECQWSSFRPFWMDNVKCVVGGARLTLLHCFPSPVTVKAHHRHLICSPALDSWFPSSSASISTSIYPVHHHVRLILILERGNYRSMHGTN